MQSPNSQNSISSSGSNTVKAANEMENEHAMLRDIPEGQEVAADEVKIMKGPELGAVIPQEAPALHASQSVQDDEYYDEEEDHGGLNLPNPFKIVWKLIKSVKNLIYAGCFLIIASIIALVVIIIFRPPIVWDPIKGFINSDLEPTAASEQSADQIIKKVESDAANGKVTISESELAVLVKDKVGFDSEVRANIDTGGLDIYINNEKEGNPLWVVVSMKQTEDKIEVDKIGFERISAPQSITSRISSGITEVLDFLKRDDMVSLVSEVLKTSEVSSNITDVKLMDGEIVITFQQ